MLASSADMSTGSWIFGIVVLVLLVGAAVWVVRRIVRIGRRLVGPQHTSEPTRLGANDEQPVAHSANIVLPQERRVRHDDEESPMRARNPRPLPFPKRPTSAAAVAPSPARAPSTGSQPPAATKPLRVKLLDRKVRIPAWLSLALAWLGVVYIVFPLGQNWYEYGFALFVAVMIGVYVARRHRVTVLQRTEHGAVLWVRWMKPGAADPEAPKVLDPPPSPSR
jgi:hypothetical protein